MPAFLAAALWGSNILGVFDLFLLRRQLSACSPSRQLPPSVRSLEISSEESFRKSQAYNYDKTLFAMIVRIKDIIEANVMLYFQVLPKLWYSTQKIFGFSSTGSFGHCCAFQAAMDGIELVINLPQHIYSTFVIEAKHGFNETTPLEFAKDKLKVFFLKSCLLNPIIASTINFVARKFGVNFPLYLFGVSSALATLMVYIFPVLIQPLFNKFTPLEENDHLHTKISALAKSVEFPLTRVYIVDASKRSAHSNAYFYGFLNNKRIVLFDTLLKQLSDDEILAVLSHELGHWYLNHTSLMFSVGLVQIAAFAFALRSSIFSPEMYHQFGFYDQTPIIGVTLFSISYFDTLAKLMGFLMTRISRACEFQADAFAIALGYRSHLRASLLKLHEKNLSPLLPDALYASLHYSHPPVVERLGKF